MRLIISMACALCLCACALLVVACSPQDGSAPAAAAAAGGRTGDATTAAQTAKPTPVQPGADDTRRIGLEEARAAADSGKAIIYDVRDEASYKANHIKGAKNIPLPQFEERIGEVPPGKLIITYCA